MNCLCCGKPLTGPEEQTGWHKRCIKRFFGTEALPRIEINDTVLKELTAESTSRGYTVPGVQKKLSLHLLSDHENPRLTLVNYPTGYILKPQVADFEALPEAEHLVMSMADVSGIATVPHALIRGEQGYAYITKRSDRIITKREVKMLAMEDFCQLDLRLTQDKYRGSYERCVKVIDRYSARKGLDRTELFMRLVFSFLVGNSDMHLKNFSLIETKSASNAYVLSPAYDLVPVNVILPEDKEEFALAMNGRKANLRRKDFLVFADECGLSPTAAEKMMDKLASMQETYLTMIRASLLPQDLQDRFARLLEDRTRRLLGKTE